MDVFSTPSSHLSSPSILSSPSSTLSSPSFFPSPPQENSKEGWVSDGNGNMTFQGNVGVNLLSPPHESLSVGGNIFSFFLFFSCSNSLSFLIDIFLTGKITAPSDIRVKKNIQPVDTGQMLSNIDNIRVSVFLFVSLFLRFFVSLFVS